MAISIKRSISAFLVAAACSLSAQAAVVTSTGTLAAPIGSYNLFNFTVSNAGMTNFQLNGNTDAWLGVFSGTNVLSTANFLGQDDDSGGWLNSHLDLNLAAGNYTAWITTHGSYWDTVSNSIVTNHGHTPMDYTLSITGDVVGGTNVPEPASMALLGLGLLGLAASRRKA